MQNLGSNPDLLNQSLDVHLHNQALEAFLWELPGPWMGVSLWTWHG